MNSILTSTFAGLSLACALVGATTIPAGAQGLDIQVGPNGIRPVIRDRDFRGRDSCNPRDALDAARDEGYRHPRIVRVTDRRVVVEGMTEDGMDQISFANRPGCPAR
jgi:hypothetical protein